MIYKLQRELTYRKSLTTFELRLSVNKFLHPSRLARELHLSRYGKQINDLIVTFIHIKRESLTNIVLNLLVLNLLSRLTNEN